MIDGERREGSGEWEEVRGRRGSWRWKGAGMAQVWEAQQRVREGRAGHSLACVMPATGPVCMHMYVCVPGVDLGTRTEREGRLLG